MGTDACNPTLGHPPSVSNRHTPVHTQREGRAGGRRRKITEGIGIGGGIEKLNKVRPSREMRSP